jgi:uncharacterized protein
MTPLRPPFDGAEAFRAAADYRLLPFRFTRLEERRYVLTNDVGEYVVMDRDELEVFVAKRLDVESPAYRALKARHFLFDDTSRVALDLLALKYRTRAEGIARFTGLHIFVTTLRCDHSCQYCQVSRQSEDRENFDMSVAHADKALAHVFRSPSPSIKVEFQGGEPLLNFDLIRHVVLAAKELNVVHQRRLAFVIASNLSHLTDEVLAFCGEHEIYLSTSLDGPAALHNQHRPRPGHDSHQRTVDGIRRARAQLGPDSVSALMTTAPGSLERVEEIIDEYVLQGFHSIFLRNLSPYGFASKSLVHRYNADDWVAFYKRGLAHVLKVNASGWPMREEFTSILLQKMFSPAGASYVDLQSPAGIAIAAVVYNYDGSIYASDEGRMLAEMGDETFRLGHLDTDSYEAVMTNESLLSTLFNTMTEGAPMCADCAFLPYCGSDPVFHRATQGDELGHKAFSAFCKKQMAVLRHVIQTLETDPVARDVMLEWT